jgi:serine/threonine protein kinase
MPGLEGTSLGRYRLKQRLGRGGMAEVYLATDERMQRDVALKIVSSSQAEFAERFSREAQAMGNLHHDHLLPAYDVGEQEPWHYLVMPYIAHGTLGDLLKRTQGPLDLDHTGELLQQIASGLQYAHQRGLIHRDIKPSNILLRDDHYAYLADFGLARVLEGGGDLTQTGTLLGTPEYMAPELAEGPADKSSDIYALAIVLYQMITGRVPFRGESAISTFWKQMRETPLPPSHSNPELPKTVDLVLMRALSKDPAQRYSTPLALSQAYQQAISELEEMPALYDTEILPQGAPAQSPVSSETSRPTPPQEKLILPGERPVPASPVGRRTRLPITPAPAAAPPARRFEQVDGQSPAQAIASPPLLRRRRRSTNRVIAGVIMGVVFLLVVSAILAYLSVQTHQQSAASSTATASAGATSTVIARQTQNVANTRASQTAGAASATAQAAANVHNAEATAAAITRGQPLLNDPLTAQDANNWPDDGTNCAFQQNAYVVTITTANRLQPCIAANPQYDNAAFQVDVTLISSADAGLVFRANASQNQFYDFEVTNQGEFYLRYFNNSAPTFLIQKTASNAIRGVGSKNTLLAIANGSDFKLFINGTLVGTIQDTTFTSGQVGVAAGTLSASNGDASFSNLRVYSLG